MRIRPTPHADRIHLAPARRRLIAGAALRARSLSSAVVAQAKTKIEEPARERHAVEQLEYEAKTAKRDAQRQEGKKPRGRDPEPPPSGPKASDQFNITDEDSRIMPASRGGFEQSYNAQAAVDAQSPCADKWCASGRTRSASRREELMTTIPVMGASAWVSGQARSPMAIPTQCGRRCSGAWCAQHAQDASGDLPRHRRSSPTATYARAASTCASSACVARMRAVWSAVVSSIQAGGCRSRAAFSASAASASRPRPTKTSHFEAVTQ